MAPRARGCDAALCDTATCAARCSGGGRRATRPSTRPTSPCTCRRPSTRQRWSPPAARTTTHTSLISAGRLSQGVGPPWEVHGSLSRPPGSGSLGSWPLDELRTSHCPARGPLEGCGPAVRPRPTLPILAASYHPGPARASLSSGSRVTLTASTRRTSTRTSTAAWANAPCGRRRGRPPAARGTLAPA